MTDTYVANVTDLSFWFDASDRSTIEVTDGIVTAWKDKSGKGNHPTFQNNATHSSTGLKGAHPGVSFNNSSMTVAYDAATMANDDGMAVFVVAHRDADIGSTQNLIQQNGSSGSYGFQLQYQDATDVIRMVKSSTGSDLPIITTQKTAVTGAIDLIDVSFNGSDTVVKVDNDNYIYGGDLHNPAEDIIIGHNASSRQITVAEVIYFNRALTATERQNIINYLAGKYDHYITENVIHRMFTYAGQSNCEGQTSINNADAKYNPAMAFADIWVRDSSEFQTYDAGTNNRTFAGAFAMSADAAMLYELNDKLGWENLLLVKYGVNGASLVNDFTADDLDASPGDEYAAWMGDIDDAITNKRLNGIETEIFAIAWTQGESEAQSALNSSLYRGLLLDLVTYSRAYLYSRGFASAGAPFLVSEVISHVGVGDGYIGAVTTAQQAVAADDSNVIYIPLETPTLLEDGVHFDADNLTALGVDFANVITERVT